MMPRAVYEWECASCGEIMAMTPEANAVLRRSGQGFKCIYGHPNIYKDGPTEADKLRKQVEEERRARQQLEQNVAMWQDAEREASQRAETERRRANAYKGHATRITKRAKAGVCPCCNRTFKQLAAHMAKQHPQFTPIEIEQTPTGTIQ